MTIITQGVEELVRYLADVATPQHILDFQISSSAQARAADLLDKQSEGTLTPAEYLELQQMAYLDRLVTLLRARALERLT